MTPDIIICLGKSLNNQDKPDWILESRLNKTIDLANEFPDIKIILTGGIGHFEKERISISQAEGMKRYILTIANELKDRIILEEKGESTIGQMCIIKTDFLMANKYKNIALITDEIHMARASILFEAILGDEYKVTKASAEINLNDNWKKPQIDKELQMILLSRNTWLKDIKKGDHEEWRRVDEEYRKKSNEEKRKIISK